LGRVKLRGGIASGDTDLFDILHHNLRTAAVLNDIADDGDELAMEVGEIADLAVITGEGDGLK
jgi:hypothetical protein